ncbi:MAG: ABC transporter permease [Lachnospira sp.]|nr:ABC transporter permease [Lachnospira sp.]
MKRVLFWIYLMLKKQLKNPFIVGLLIAIPLVTLIAKNIPALNKTDTIQVGLVLLDEDEMTVQAANALVSGDYSVDFYIADSREDLVNDIVSKKTECGYVFSENISEKIMEDNYNGCIECVINESNYVSSMTNEIVFSQLFKSFADDILVKFIKENKVFSSDAAKAVVNAKASYEKYLSSDQTFHLTFTTLDNDGQSTRQMTQTTGKFPLRAILYILIFAGGLFGVAWFLEDEAKGSYVTLSKRYKILARPVYAFIGAFLFWISSSIALLIAGSKISPKTVLLGIAYVFLVTAYAWILGMIFRRIENYIAITFVLIVACFIFCPVFINISLYIDAAKYISAILLPSWFI